jgi:hypothetical protein
MPGFTNAGQAERKRPASLQMARPPRAIPPEYRPIPSLDDLHQP